MNHHPAPNAQLVSTFDLRVVAGLHAGARIAIGRLGEDARVVDALTLGHGTDCDVVLQDPSLAEGNLTIRLVRNSSGMVRGWQAERDDTLDVAHEAIALGEVMRWDGLGLTVAAQDTPWPSIDIMHEATIAQSAARASEVDAGSQLASDGSADIKGNDRSANAKHGAGSEDANGSDGLAGAESHPHEHAQDDPHHYPHDRRADDDADSTTRKRAGIPGGNGELAHSGDAGPDRGADTRTDAGTPAATRAGAVGDSDASHAEAPKRWLSRLRAMLSMIPGAVIAAVVSVLVVLALGMLLIRVLNGSGSKKAGSNNTAKVAVLAANQSAAQVTKVIDGLGLSSALHLQTTPDGLVAVVGWVRDEAQHDQLASALAQVSPMPAMLVNLESDAVNATQQIAAQYGSLIDVINQGGGKIRVIGLIQHPGDRGQLEAAFHSQLPTAVLVDDRLLDREQMAVALESHLIDAGMGSLSVVWTSAGMQIVSKSEARSEAKSEPALESSVKSRSKSRSRSRSKSKSIPNPARTRRIDGDKLYATVQAFKQQYGMHLPIFASLDGEQETLQPRALPFTISSITGGPLPSVVVDDGPSGGSGQTRLLPGGIYRGYRLISVTPQQVIFDGPQRVVVTR